MEILKGFMRMRADLTHNGVAAGFQWLDGSFLENIEATESRAPKDIDVVTYYTPSSPMFSQELVAAFPELLSPREMKRLYHVDHYTIDLSIPPMALVETSRYWFGLFSHTRGGVWKGMLRLQLDTPQEDEDANDFLSTWLPPVEEAI